MDSFNQIEKLTEAINRLADTLDAGINISIDQLMTKEQAVGLGLDEADNE